MSMTNSSSILKKVNTKLAVSYTPEIVRFLKHALFQRDDFDHAIIQVHNNGTSLRVNDANLTDI